MTAAALSEKAPAGATNILPALIDIGTVILFSLAGLGIEMGAQKAGLFNLTESASGLVGVMGGLAGVLFVSRWRGITLPMALLWTFFAELLVLKYLKENLQCSVTVTELKKQNDTPQQQ